MTCPLIQRVAALGLQGHLCDYSRQVLPGVGSVVTLEAADVVEQGPAVKANQPYDGLRRLGVHILLLAQDHLRDHFGGMHRAKRRGDDVQPHGRTMASPTVFVVATGEPQRRSNRHAWHAHYFLDSTHLIFGRGPFETSRSDPGEL